MRPHVTRWSFGICFISSRVINVTVFVPLPLILSPFLYPYAMLPNSLHIVFSQTWKSLGMQYFFVGHHGLLGDSVDDDVAYLLKIGVKVQVLTSFMG